MVAEVEEPEDELGQGREGEEQERQAGPIVVPQRPQEEEVRHGLQNQEPQSAVEDHVEDLQEFGGKGFGFVV